MRVLALCVFSNGSYKRCSMFPATAEYGTLGARMRGDLDDLVSGNCSIKDEEIKPPRTKLKQAIKRIDELDLTDVKTKLGFPEVRGGLEWTPAHADAVEKAYKDFLKECLTADNLSPDSDVDNMWHIHILFTREYARDCQHIFGCFLHHAPTITSKVGHECQRTSKCCCTKGR